MKKPTTIVLISALIITAALIFLYMSNRQTASETETQDDRIQILATTGMIGDIAKNVGGEAANVTVLMGPGIDPHTYKAKTSDIDKMRDADIIFYNGLYLEAQIKDALDGLDEKVVSVSDDIDRETLLAWDVDGADVPESESYDPHIWNDVSLWIDATYKVSDTLQERDPTQAETYEQNAQIYIAQLQELDEYARAQIATIPENRRYLISTHDAFSYFSRAYNIPTRALLGISTEAEASTQDVQELSDFIVENNIPAIFGENITSDKFAQSVLEAVEEKGHTVVIGPELLSDALGEEGSPQDSYEGMIRSNVDSIVNALTETE